MISTTQNAKLLTSRNLCHSLMLCHVTRSQRMGECETLQRHTRTRYVDSTPTSEVTPVTIWYIHGQTSQYHDHEWMTHILYCSMSIGHPKPEKKLFQTLTLKFQLQGQGHGCGQRTRSYNWPSIILTHLVFISHQSDQQFLRFQELFRNLTLKHPRSRSWVRSKVKVTYCTQCPTDALPFRLTSIGPTIPEIWPK